MPLEVKPYGSWASPIDSEKVVELASSLANPQIDEDYVYWVELRPAESGRYVVARRPLNASGEQEDVTPQGFSVRTRVHEYGGNAFVVHDGSIYFSNDVDKGVYVQRPPAEKNVKYVDSTPVALMPPNPAYFYADFLFDSKRNRLVCIKEDQSVSPDPRESEDSLVSIDCCSGAVSILSRGRSFYASPRMNSDCSKLAFLCWDLPQMPWDGSEVWEACLSDAGETVDPQLVAGSGVEACDLPCYSPVDNKLYFVNERNGWLQIHCVSKAGDELECVCPMEAEFSHPLWVFGRRCFDFLPDGRILCIYQKTGRCHLGILDQKTKEIIEVETGYQEMDQLRISENGKSAVFLAGSPTQKNAVILLNTTTRDTIPLTRENDVVDLAYMSTAQPIEFPTEHGLTAHAFFYAPKNPNYVPPKGEKPPLIALSHGGPTARTSCILSPAYQYWTTRGFAIVDVNYGGSTGYGKAYRERLVKNWGVVDVDDCCNAAKYLAKQGLVDENRLAIRGGSAGGYTTLAALTFRDTFQAGVCNYGIGNLLTLELESHKFESRYCLRLVGSFPEDAPVFYGRSPINHVDQLNCPMLFFHGDEDKVVPPDQAVEMYEAVKAKGLPVSLNILQGEQHGFRKAENIKLTIEGQLYFFSKIFDFEPADRNLMTVKIDNLKE